MVEPQGWYEIEPIEWRAPKFDLAELAKLRWIEKLSRKELAKRFGKTEAAIQQHFHKLKLKDFRVPGLDLETRQMILLIVYGSAELARPRSKRGAPR